MSTEPNLINSNQKPIELFETWFEEAKKEVFIKIDPEYNPCEILK